MAGTISLSLSQQLNELGEPLAEGRLYFYQAGTVSTPQNAYYDADLTLPLPNPYTLDAAGRIPQFFLADGSIKVVLIDRHGTTQISADNILVIGPSGGGGGGGSVDPTTVWQTGMLAQWYDTGVKTGFVRGNGRTIGSATSGATERANADTQALFVFLYNADANLTVSSGRGVSAAADFAANKTIALPDFRGRIAAALDDMGNSAAGRITAGFLGTAVVLGAAGGNQGRTLTLSEIPTGITISGSNNITVTNSGTITSTGSNNITASGSNSITASGSNSISVTSMVSDILRATVHDNFTSVAGDNGPIHSVTGNAITSTNPSQNITVANAAQDITVANAAQNITVSTASGSVTSTGTNIITGTSTNTGGAAHSMLNPMMLVTVYIKL